MDRPKKTASSAQKPPKTSNVRARPSGRAFALRVGLVGGGQLARMLALKAHELGLETHVLCPRANEPAAQVATHWVEGSPDSRADLLRLAAHVDVVTIESEFHAGSMLADVRATSGVPLWPAPASISLWQDRASQKQALINAGVPTSAFAIIEDETSARNFFAEHGRIVFKKRHGGYDGYGTFMARTPRELQDCLTKLDFSGGAFIAEAFVPFKRELAISFARNPRGQIAALPLVQTHQVDHRLDWLKGPVRHPGLAKLRQRVARLLKTDDFVGAIAFELFDTGRELLVNEVAPRVHNSAHASLEALDVDQFTLHLKAILDEDLADPVTLGRGFALVNLIGAGGSALAAPRKRHGHLHWYGKTDSRKGRKMGHLTWVGADADEGLKLLLRERKGFQL